MCAYAVLWAGIPEVVYGQSIQASILQGRKRIGPSCTEIFQKAGAGVRVYPGVLEKECAVLYRTDVRNEIKKLRNADDEELAALDAESAGRRVQWFKENQESFAFLNEDTLDTAYRLLLHRFGISPEEAPVTARTDREIIFHSVNFCPTLEACKILGLDTRQICRKLNENATKLLIGQVDPRLCFSRNYDKLRPYSDYCEEMIGLTEKAD